MRNFALLLILFGSLFSAGLSWSNNIEIKSDTISETIFHDAINGLSSKSFTKKKEYIQVIANSKDRQAPFILQQLLDGNIYFLKKTKEPRSSVTTSKGMTAILSCNIYTTMLFCLKLSLPAQSLCQFMCL